MLTKLRVKNFKCFRDEIIFDLSNTENYDFSLDAIRDNHVNKAIIYGFNGSGKSNLGLAIMDITINLTDFNHLNDRLVPYRNLDSGEKTVIFSYEFSFGKDTVCYNYEKIDFDELCLERLLINDKEVIYYNHITHEGFVKLAGAETLNLENHESNISRVKYVKSNSILDPNIHENQIFKKFTSFVDHMLLFYSLRHTGYMGFKSGREKIGKKIIEDNAVDDFNAFLKKLHIDIFLKKDVVESEEDGLFASYKNGSAPFFSVASTGTSSLSLFYYWYRIFSEVSFVFIDEFDAFYHYELARDIVRLLLEIKNVQAIMTTHNTNLMTNELLRPDCYYYLRDGNIKAIAKCTERDIRYAHDLQRMFKAGAFGDII